MTDTQVEVTWGLFRQGAERGDKLNAFIKRLSIRTNTTWALSHTYLTRLGNYRAVLVAALPGTPRMAVRWSQNGWKRSHVPSGMPWRRPNETVRELV